MQLLKNGEELTSNKIVGAPCPLDDNQFYSSKQRLYISQFKRTRSDNQEATGPNLSWHVYHKQLGEFTEIIIHEPAWGHGLNVK